MDDRPLSNEEIAASLLAETQRFLGVTSHAIVTIAERQQALTKVLNDLSTLTEKRFGACNTVFADTQQRFEAITAQLNSIVSWIEQQGPKGDDTEWWKKD